MQVIQPNEMIDIVSWLDDSTIAKDDWIIFRMGNTKTPMYGFKKLNDAMLFKLSWG